jgi:hypothetical protein
MRRAPPRLRLQHVPPERDLTEDAAHRVRVVAADEIRQCVDRIAHRMEPAQATRPGNRMDATFDGALGNGGVPRRPVQLVQHGAEPQTGRRLPHGPRTPTDHGAGELANDLAGVHQRAIAA